MKCITIYILIDKDNDYHDEDNSGTDYGSVAVPEEPAFFMEYYVALCTDP